MHSFTRRRLEVFLVRMNRKNLRLFFAGALPDRQTAHTLAGSALASAVLALTAFAAAAGARAADVQVAVAANFAEPAKEIAAGFERSTGAHVALSVGSSGQFYAQIAHGAPFEVLLSADAERPRRAEAEGFAVPGTRFTYAVGRLVLYSRKPGLVDAGGEVLRGGRFEKLAIADPAAAPYGAAAVQAMTRMGVYDRLKARIAQGASIGQTYGFVESGAADLGFVALSQVIDVAGGSRWLAPQALYDPIDQDAVLLKPGERDPAARAFLAYLKGPQAQAVIRRFGYGTR
jgi:molybdate transport system substrate-binding protein